MWCSGTRASADSRRMVISFRLISSEKMHRGHAVLDGRRPREVQPQRRVVGRDHRPAGEVEVVGVVDLHATHRHDSRPDGRRRRSDRPSRRGPDRRSLCASACARARNTSSAVVKVRRETRTRPRRRAAAAATRRRSHDSSGSRGSRAISSLLRSVGSSRRVSAGSCEYASAPSRRAATVPVRCPAGPASSAGRRWLARAARAGSRSRCRADAERAPSTPDATHARRP